MIDALLTAVRDSIREVLSYSEATCELMDAGNPPPRCGDYFVAVHPGGPTSAMMNALNEYFDFSLTLTMRTTNVPLDRVGDRLLVKKLAETTGFNARADLLRAFCHMNWDFLAIANNLMVERANALGAAVVYGFCEPAHFSSMDFPVLVGGEWFSNPESDTDIALKAELRFEGARRLQPIGTYV